jgi:hypothetical protein
VANIIIGIPNSTVAEESQLPNGAIMRIRRVASGPDATTFEVSASAYQFLNEKLKPPRKRTLYCRNWILEKLEDGGQQSLNNLLRLNPPFSRSAITRALKSLLKTAHINVHESAPNGAGRPARLYNIRHATNTRPIPKSLSP